MHGDIHRRRISAYFSFMVVLCIILSIIMIYSMGSSQFHYHSYLHRNPYAALFVMMGALILLLYQATEKYTFTANSLLITNILKKKEIYYSSITHLEKMSYRTRPLLLKRNVSILIRYSTGKAVFIVPVNMDEFLSKLVSRLPNPNVYVKK